MVTSDKTEWRKVDYFEYNALIEQYPNAMCVELTNGNYIVLCDKKGVPGDFWDTDFLPEVSLDKP